MFSAAVVRTASKSLLRNSSRANQVKTVVPRAFLSSKTPDKPDGEEEKIPFGIGKMFGIGEPDNLIPTNKDRKTKEGYMPEFLPDDVKKDMKELGLDSIEELDEMEEANLDGYNDLGLVPPEDTGTFESPILIPSRRPTRVVGYVEPASHSMQWFIIHNDDNKYYLPDLGLFFKMLYIPDEEAIAQQNAHH